MNLAIPKFDRRWRPLARFLVLLHALLPLAAAQKRPAENATGPDTLSDSLSRGFKTPPASAKLRCYWWWLDGHTDKATITHDLEEMAAKGYGGALLVDAGGATQGGHDSVPAGPKFGSPQWVELYLHALREAHRLNLEITLNITSGWNLGGPDVTPEHASKLLTWSQTIVAAHASSPQHLDTPPVTNGFYRQIAVLAYPLHEGTALAGAEGSKRHALGHLAVKSAAAEMGFSMPDADYLLTDQQPGVKDADAELAEVVDISSNVDADGSLHWSPPADTKVAWEILRIGYTDSDARVSTSSDTWQGLAIDYLDPHELDRYWDASIEPLLRAAKPYAGSTLKYVATDSWELGGTNWTGAFREEFRKRRGYDPLHYLPIVAGRILDSRAQSTRFLADLRRTVADLVNTHYDRMAERAKAWGMGTQCESGGPHGAPLDGLETFRSSAIPQTEYWAKSLDHRSTDADRYFVKEVSSAAHIYGRPFAAAEGMTSIGNQWSESIDANLRPSFDQALTEGMNRLVWHEFTSSPKEMGLPGQEYFAGTHLNPNVTWWNEAGSFLQYLNRSQFLLQQGLPVSDLLYYYGDNVPNFVRLKQSDPAKVLPGYDYDVTDTETLLGRTTIGGNLLRTPEGIRYRALALPAARILPLPALQFAERYARAGGTLIGERPLHSQGVASPEEEQQFQHIVDALWKPCEAAKDHVTTVGNGRLYCTGNAHEALQRSGVAPDFEVENSSEAKLDYVHRSSADAEIYFVRNTLDRAVSTRVLFRVDHRQPIFFHADTGESSTTLLFAPTPDSRTTLPFSLGPHESVFIVFRGTSAHNYVTSIEQDGKTLYRHDANPFSSLPASFAITARNTKPVLHANEAGTYQITFADGVRATASEAAGQPLAMISPWTLSFPPNWGAPASVQVDRLQSWTGFSDPGIRYFSGTATYRTVLTLTQAQATSLAAASLRLGEVHEVAHVRVNGKDAGVLWKAPYAVRVDGFLHAGENQIEVQVTNLWPNRIIGDAQDPAGKHYTSTNIRSYNKNSPLLPSGMFGPVELVPVHDHVLDSSH